MLPARQPDGPKDPSVSQGAEEAVPLSEKMEKNGRNIAREKSGAGIQRLRELNQSLQKELARNQHLAERLLETEESVRRDVARELHDDIGQTITAIRTQAGIVQRLAADNASVKQSGQLIEQLSLGVYDAVRRLLGRLRPRQLDDLTLEQAIRSLMREMELEGRGIVSHLEWRIDESALSENQRVTLFRVCQEGLNNIVKHADASAVTLQGWQQDERLMLVIEDDGSGAPFVRAVTSAPVG